MCASAASNGYLEILERLLPPDPGKAFDLAMCMALGGGRRSVFQLGSMGADRLAGMVGHLLADHPHAFYEDGRH